MAYSQGTLHSTCMLLSVDQQKTWALACRKNKPLLRRMRSCTNTCSVDLPTPPTGTHHTIAHSANSIEAGAEQLKLAMRRAALAALEATTQQLGMLVALGTHVAKSCKPPNGRNDAWSNKAKHQDPTHHTSLAILKAHCSSTCTCMTICDKQAPHTLQVAVILNCMYATGPENATSTY